MHNTRFVYPLLLLAVIFAWAYFSPHTRTLTFTENGFSPSTITVTVGDTVTFVNKSKNPFWPASNFHPTHALFPAFDAKKPIAPNDSWSFTFEKPGTFPFHDHLASQFTGTVTVLGTLEDLRKACLAAKAVNALTPECWGLEVKDVLSKKGLDGAFSYIDGLYTSDSRFRANCHDVMHILGAEAYLQFKSDSSIIDLPQTSYCGYGFYHGFIETMLSENGPTEYADVRNYCERLNIKYGEAASGPCFHGIGHAIFDSLDGSIWGDRGKMVTESLSRCEQAVTTATERSQCGSGVFNSFANALSAKNYALSFDGFNPVSFCAAQKNIYVQGCLGEAGIGYIRDQKMQRSQVYTFIEALPSGIRQYMYFVYFADDTKRAINDFPADDFRDACEAFTETINAKGCIQGVVQGLREESQAGLSHRSTFPFCKSFSVSGLRDFCYDDVINRTNVLEEETSAFKAACIEYTGRADIQCKQQ